MYCDKCLSIEMRQCEVYKNIIKTEAILDSVAFGDDGAAYYYTEELNEYKGECIECGKCHFSLENIT